MVANFHSLFLDSVTVGNIDNTGDGIVMGLSAGAGLASVTSGMEWFDFAFAKPSRKFGVGISNRQWNAAALTAPINMEAVPSKIFVNMEGNRFMDESVMQTHNKLYTLPWLQFSNTGAFAEPSKTFKNLPMFMVCDGCIKGAPLGKVPADNEWTYPSAHGTYEWSDDNQAEIEKGWILKADTIEELASMMSATDYVYGTEKTVDAEVLEATIEAWNEACEAGVDQFGRPAEWTRRAAASTVKTTASPACATHSVGCITWAASWQCA